MVTLSRIVEFPIYEVRTLDDLVLLREFDNRSEADASIAEYERQGVVTVMTRSTAFRFAPFAEATS